MMSPWPASSAATIVSQRRDWIRHGTASRRNRPRHVDVEALELAARAGEIEGRIIVLGEEADLAQGPTSGLSGRRFASHSAGASMGGFASAAAAGAAPKAIPRIIQLMIE